VLPEDTKTVLYNMLSKLAALPAEAIRPEMKLFGRDLALDSLSGVELVTWLEQQFGITLEDLDVDLSALDSVGSLLRFINGQISERWTGQLEKVAAAARLKEGRFGVEQVLLHIREHPGATSRELAAWCSLPTPTIAALRKELHQAGLVGKEGKGAFLSPKGEALLETFYPSWAGVSASAPEPYGRARQSPLFAELTERCRALLRHRPPADTQLDQAKCLPETAAARALLALENGLLAGRRLAFLGDDDFTSVAVAVLGDMLAEHQAAGPAAITVLDIDERIVNTLTELAEQHSWPLLAYGHDLRRPLPADLLHRHDGFFTDPPYTVTGARLFVSRGVEMCRPEGFTAFLSFAPKGPDEMLAVQADMARMGLYLREIKPGFNRYEGGSLWGNQSHMLVYSSTTKTRPLLTTNYEGQLYTAEFRQPTLRQR